MKAMVDDERCRGYGVCCSLCPEVFTLTDGGYSEARTDDVPPEFEESVRLAVDSCPEGAITAT